MRFAFLCFVHLCFAHVRGSFREALYVSSSVVQCLPVSCSVLQCPPFKLRAASLAIPRGGSAAASPVEPAGAGEGQPMLPMPSTRNGAARGARGLQGPERAEQSTSVNNVSNGQADGPRGLRVNSVRRLLARDVKVYIHVYISYTDIYMYTRVYIHVYM